MDRESLVSILGAESGTDSIDLVRQLTRQWKVVRADLDLAALEPAARDRVQFVTQLTALLPLAASLSALVCAADSVDEMLPMSATAVSAEEPAVGVERAPEGLSAATAELPASQPVTYSPGDGTQQAELHVRKGERVYRKGKPCTVVDVNYGTDPVHVVVRLEDGREVGTEEALLSREAQDGIGRDAA